MLKKYGEPQSRAEALLQNILGESYDIGAPRSRNEIWLMAINGVTGLDLPEPQSRIEYLLKEIYENGTGGVEVEELTVTENKTYTAPSGKAYSPVIVNVPTPAPVLESLNAPANGDYTPGQGVDGFNSVHVNVPPAADPRVANILDPPSTPFSLDLSDLTITQIRDSQFLGYTTLAGITFPSTLANIWAKAFKGCTALSGVTIPASVERVDENSFDGSGIQSFTCLGALNLLRSQSLANCAALTSVNWEHSPVTIGSNAFMGCALPHIWLSNDTTTIAATSASGAPFRNCTQLTDIYCEAASKPAGWQNYWNYTNSNTQATVHWGVSKAEYDEIVNA